MKRYLIAAAILMLPHLAGRSTASAQGLDELNLQIHGYATQGFVYTTKNNWNTLDSTAGSEAWTEAVVNVTVQPQSRLRIGVQARYSLLGTLNNGITLDWAQADYKVNDRFGVRFGKVKTPQGLLNETQDIDPAYLWVVLPQSVYPLASRNGVLSHYGGVAYGALQLGSLGTIDYRGFGGVRVLQPNDGYFQAYRDAGFSAPYAIAGPVYGATLRWHSPVHGLMFSATESSQTKATAAVDYGPYRGVVNIAAYRFPILSGKYERKKVMFTAEYLRLASSNTMQFPGVPLLRNAQDQRNFYFMSSYNLTSKLTGGLYFSSLNDHQAAFTSARFQKDWALAARYDFSEFLYAKVEQHFVDGTAIGFSSSNNPNGLQPTNRMTMLKLGVSF